jgi:cyclophilin family peptidyl-prolyl cis-trans isomerase
MTRLSFSTSAFFVTLAAALSVSCSTHPVATADASTEAGASGVETTDRPVARAEDVRKAKDISPEVRTSHDVKTRRRSARALGRIADADSIDSLVMHLADDDAETVAWAAYGLGYACKGREDAHVRILAARGANLPPSAKAAVPRGTAELDPRVAVARAIGRCGGSLSEGVLVSLLGSHGEWTDPALLGLGDLATRKKQLGAEAMTALLDAAADRASPHDLAFYALGRAGGVEGETFARRVVDTAKVALGRPGQERIFAIRALGRAGRENAKETAPELARVVVDRKGFGHGERAEAARWLGTLAEPGQHAIAGAIADLTPDAKDPIAIAGLASSDFHVLYTLLGVLGPEAPKKAEPALSVLASLTPPTQPKPGFARRLADLRCSAALALARGAYDADILKKCDAESSAASQRARLASLLRTKTLGRERLAVFRALAKSEHLRIREEVVSALGTHDIGDAGIPIIADALTSKHAGLVATAAELLNAHPDRALVLAESERRAALDPKAPPPTTSPAQDIAPAITKALAAALSEHWPEDRFETRIALVEAAASLRHPQAKDAALTACKDPNPVLHERALKALRTLGTPVAACDGTDRTSKAAAEIGATLTKPTKVILSTDALELTIVLEPELSPITATRIAALVKSGFYKGIVVHRVVPGFVVQLGDPDGDGYGGSGTSLRCETSPVPFAPLDVGMALAGRDTGSSQFFVTLSRTPHLDGEYTRVGHAEGDWASVAQGDVIESARLVE